MCRHGFDVQANSCGLTAESLGADSQLVDRSEERRVKSVRYGVDLGGRRVLCEGCLVKRSTANAYLPPWADMGWGLPVSTVSQDEIT